MKERLPNICVECNSVKRFYGFLSYYDTENMPHCKECFNKKINLAKEKYISAANKVDLLPTSLDKIPKIVLNGTYKNFFYIIDNKDKIKISFYKYSDLLLFILEKKDAVCSCYILEEQLNYSKIPDLIIYHNLLEKIILLRNFNDR